MKIFLGQKNHDVNGLQNAQGCFTTNLVMPGLGSLVGGRKIGIVQLALCLAGFGITLGFGVHFIFWALAHWSEFYGNNPDADPLVPLRDLWQQARWPMLGIFVFAFTWLWALFTSRSILREAKSSTRPTNP
jgi:hypothetical protein